ncbi:mate efflux family protein [Grosmannia clavigera kw1407]|uniref:Mate efflux family protein n=1 Tax=Grosmannia clavigera (strain kw1407 / UAMH 11150) TaxID=655863 RepID=F0X7Q6_GROCL|nr:mate efflux family protein [Grosmannia clavigera kw1407]EFX06256.1 mate efflux family protein [Grosmannia clavigera kw1407]
MDTSDQQDETTRPLLGHESRDIRCRSRNESRNTSRSRSSGQALKRSGWRAELGLLAKYSLPLIGTYLLQYSFTVITTMVAGRLSADDLAAASIGVTTMNIFGLAVVEGMATALDTLCAQAYGAGQLTGVGLHVQRMLLLMLLAMVPVGGLWLASPLILPRLVRQHELAVKAGSFLQLSLVGLPGYAAFEAGKRFLQAQGGFRAAMIVLLVCAPVNAVLSWLFAFHLGMGLDGAALGAAIANDLRPLLLLGYVLFFGRWSHTCWPGFSPAALCRDWAPMVRLALAGSAVTLAEWAAFEILTFSTSYVSSTHLAAQTVLTTTSVVMWHIPFSVSVAVSTRIGHLVGAGLIPAARRAAALYSVVFVVIGLFDGIFLVSLRHHLGLVFSDDGPVRELAAQAMLAVGAFQIVDAINCGCNGVLRGLGRQSLAAWLVFFVNYFAAVPLAIWLELGPWHLELNGVWIGLGLGMIVIVVAECGYIKYTDWSSYISREQGA